MAKKEFSAPLQLIRDSEGKTHPWYMSGKASIDELGNITTVTHLESHVDLSGFTGGMTVEFFDSRGNSLFVTPHLQYGVDGRFIFFGTPSPRTVNNTFKVDPSIYAQVDQCTIMLFHFGKNRFLPDIMIVLPIIVKIIAEIVKVVTEAGNTSGTGGRNDVSVLQSNLEGATVYALHDGGSTKGEIKFTWNLNKFSSSPKPSTTLVEDCILIDYSKVSMVLIENRYKIVQGTMWLLDFGTDRTSASKALDIIRFYKFTSQCFVGGPKPPMQYYLCNGMSPVGVFPGEDAIGFNPSAITVEKINNSWKIVEGTHYIMDFGSSETDAQKAYSIIQKYGFNKICFVGRPNPPMMYFRR